MQDYFSDNISIYSYSDKIRSLLNMITIENREEFIIFSLNEDIIFSIDKESKSYLSIDEDAFAKQLHIVNRNFNHMIPSFAKYIIKYIFNFNFKITTIEWSNLDFLKFSY